MGKEKYSYYEFSVFEDVGGDGWGYEIYTDSADYIRIVGNNVLRESDEWYESESVARERAMHRIDLFESGEG